ncbi:MAG: TlpA family protein disulfide reductase [Vicingus serpentipes]|nr:TlpA family protein disulfide reductase [Vicingus serpentipes]
MENDIPVDAQITKSNNSYEIIFTNASEKIKCKSINVIIKNNTIKINDPFFNTWFEAKIVSSTKMEGFWYKENKEYKIPFTATNDDTERFPKPKPTEKPSLNITGKWAVDFSKNDPENHYKSVGLFQQDGDHLTGTFLTETGDYRYLEGNMYGENFYLSCYDGSHLFLFKATLKNDTLKGWFWSGKHWEEPWEAYRNDGFELTHPDSLTYLKEGYDQLDFTFPNLQGEQVSLSDKKYENKVVIVNVMGPWCPNCKDETAYLTELYNKNHALGLEIIALSFDRSDDFETAKNNILKLKNYFNSDYDFLIAGKASKIESAKSLPMLNHVMSYPTSIFIDRKGSIRKIRTGFYGPGTGDYYLRYVEQTNDFIAKLLAEGE